MLRALIHGLTILHLGPGIAFVALAFGCEATPPALGAVCQRGSLDAFVWITVVSWLVLGLGAVAIARVRGKAKAADTPSDGAGNQDAA